MLIFDNIWYEYRKQTINRPFASSNSHPSRECTAMFPITCIESFDSVFGTIGERYNFCQPDVIPDRRQSRGMR